jgi:broad specificity phosphatase PhoE
VNDFQLKLSISNIVMYSSDLLRAKHTAEIIAAFLNIEPIFTDLLRERNLGEAVGKSVEWAHKKYDSLGKDS